MWKKTCGSTLPTYIIPFHPSNGFRWQVSLLLFHRWWARQRDWMTWPAVTQQVTTECGSHRRSHWITHGPPVCVPLPVQTENSQARRVIWSVPGWAQGNANPLCRKTTSNQASKNSRDEVPRKINNKVIVFFCFFFNHNVQRNKALWARASKNNRQENQTHKDFRYGTDQTQGMKYQV